MEDNLPSRSSMSVLRQVAEKAFVYTTVHVVVGHSVDAGVIVVEATIHLAAEEALRKVCELISDVMTRKTRKRRSDGGQGGDQCAA